MEAAVEEDDVVILPSESATTEQASEDDVVIEFDAELLRRTKTLRQLRDMCKERGLPDHGKKNDLVERLVAALE